jgi:hypothetical protein
MFCDDIPLLAPHARRHHFKITLCSKQFNHDWNFCPYAHPGMCQSSRQSGGEYARQGFGDWGDLVAAAVYCCAE